MKPFTYDPLPGRVLFGAGTIGQAATEMLGLGVLSALVISDQNAKLIAERVAEDLGGRCAGLFTEVRQHVPEELASRAKEFARTSGADGVITIGGGSATGLGKAVVVDSGAPLVAVPTTYAGSEMTPIYGLTGKRKVTAREARALPRVVIYDPDLTLTLPPQVAGPSGMNAVAHCVEALYGPATNPVIALVAREGLRVLAQALPAIVDRPGDPEARSNALYGAYLAGAALAVAGTALHHKICHVLGGSFGLPHGPVNAVMLPYVVAYNTEAAPAAMAEISAAMVGRPDPAAAAPAIAALVQAMGAPTSLLALGMPEAGLERAAAQATAEVGSSNPAPVDEAKLLELLRAAFHGRPLDECTLAP